MSKPLLIKEELDSLKVTDIYSLILFALYKMRDIPEYSTLSELAYILDKNSLLKFFDYFGGLTIKVPTLKDFKLVINGLLLYQYVNIDGIEYAQALKQLDKSEYQLKEIKAIYQSLCDILDKYDFKRAS